MLDRPRLACLRAEDPFLGLEKAWLLFRFLEPDDGRFLGPVEGRFFAAFEGRFLAPVEGRLSGFGRLDALGRSPGFRSPAFGPPPGRLSPPALGRSPGFGRAPGRRSPSGFRTCLPP